MTLNGFRYDSSLREELNRRSSGQFINRIRLNTQRIIIANVRHISSWVELTSDRIVFHYLQNELLTGKFNITIPYSEIATLRYHCSDELCIFVIKPIRDSYEKLYDWVRKNCIESGFYNMNEFECDKQVVPSNFVMIEFLEKLSRGNTYYLRRMMVQQNPSILHIEMNEDQARAFFQMDSTNSTQQSKQVKLSTDDDVIVIDDDDDDPCSGTAASSFDSRKLFQYTTDDNLITLYGSDLECLYEGKYLNDNILNFYLLYIQNQMPSLRTVYKVHIYDTLFAGKLLEPSRSFDEERFTALYHQSLKKWTKNVNLLTKDFIIIPLWRDKHWFLAIICYVANILPPEFACKFNANNANDSGRRPAIIFMDSVNNVYTYNSVIYKTVHKYLELEVYEKALVYLKKNDLINFQLTRLKQYVPKVPQQQNHYDCGLYMLEYIERFLQDPDNVYQLICENKSSLVNWFHSNMMNGKRQQIRKMILDQAKAVLPPSSSSSTSQLKVSPQKVHTTTSNNSDVIIINGTEQRRIH